MKITWTPKLTDLLVTTNRAVSVDIEDFVINNSNEEKLLGIKIHTKLSFENHLSSLKNASQTLPALARVVIYMELSKRKCLMKTFVTSQFNYCLLIWMFHGGELNKRFNRIHERALRFAKLLEKDNSGTIHQRNLRVVAAESFKSKNGLAPEIMKEVL